MLQISAHSISLELGLQKDNYGTLINTEGLGPS